MILSHRIFLAIMCDNHAMKKVLINLLFLRMNILLMIISLLLMRVSILLLIISLETLKCIYLLKKKISKKKLHNSIIIYLIKLISY
jgi:hypothetical protein